MVKDGTIKRWIISGRRAAVEPLDANGLRRILERSSVRIVESPSSETRRPRALVDGTAETIERLRRDHGESLLASENTELTAFPPPIGPPGLAVPPGPSAPAHVPPTSSPQPHPPRPGRPTDGEADPARRAPSPEPDRDPDQRRDRSPGQNQDEDQDQNDG